MGLSDVPLDRGRFLTAAALTAGAVALPQWSTGGGNQEWQIVAL